MTYKKRLPIIEAYEGKRFYSKLIQHYKPHILEIRSNYLASTVQLV